MIKINVTKSIIQAAQQLFDFKRLNNSITAGEGNLSGAIGEVMVRQYYNGIQQNTYDYDLLIGRYKIDVKTKRYTAKFTPTPKWNLNVPDFNTTQKCDYYCFLGLADDHSVGYIYGFIRPQDFYQKAIFGKKGAIDPRGNGIWRYRADCYNILIEQLRPPKIR